MITVAIMAAYVTCCAAEMASEVAPCNHLADNDPATIWHTPYNPDGPPPHWIEMRFPEAGRVISCDFRHRPSGVNGTPGSVTISGVDLMPNYALWPDGPDGSIIRAVFDPPWQIQHADHALRFDFSADFNGNPWTSLAEIDCEFVPDAEPTVDPPCENYGYTPTPVFEFDSPHVSATLAGFGIYVAEAGGDWELRHIMNCGYAVQGGNAVWVCPQTTFALQKYAELSPCSMYHVGVTAIGRDEWVESEIATDDTTWTWNEWWECEPVPNGCAPMMALP